MAHTMKNVARVVAAVAVVIMMAAGTSFAEITPIPVANGSFEVPGMNPNDWTINNIPGWTVGPNTTAGIWRPDGQYAVSDGQNALWINSGYVSQVLSTTLNSNSLYTLQVDVGQRNDRNA